MRNVIFFSTLILSTWLAGTAVSSAAGSSALLTPVTGSTLIPGPIAFPAGFMPSVKSYGAVGDGRTDDTAAIQKALSDGRSSSSTDYYGRPKALFFPPGTYLVRKTLQWVGCCVTLQGSGTGSTIIRLAPGSSGFSDPAHPKPLILTPAGNQSFHQNIWDLQLDTGADNPGATALNYISNNSGSVHDLLIRSEDGQGHAGIDLTRNWAGPLLIRNSEIEGFDVGVDLKNAEYGSTLEFITLKNQAIAGIRNTNQPLNIHGLISSNTVPALTNAGGFVVLLDAELGGGKPAAYALQTNNNMYLRNVHSSGYLATLKNTSGVSLPLVSGIITEHLVGAPQTLTGALSDGSLGLNVEETPADPAANLSTSATFTPRWYGDTAGLQSLLNSGKETIYFPFASYFSSNEAAVIVPDTVHRIVGFSSVINGNSRGFNGGGIRFIVQSNTTQPLIIEQFGYGLKVDHVGARPVAIKDAKVDYESSPGAGNLFLEDVEVSKPLVIQRTQSVWARQLNDEVTGTKITNDGGSLWILGLKTEGIGTVIDTTAGGQTELLGALIYPVHTVPSSDAAFVSDDAKVSYMYTESVYSKGEGYSIQVRETRSGKTRIVPSSSSNHYRMPLFIGYQ